MSDTEVKKKRGCWFYGCITFFVLTLILVLGIFLSIRFVVNKFQSYTDAQQTPMEVVQLTEPEQQALEKRVEDFKMAVEGGTEVPPLELTAGEVNAWINRDPLWKGKILVDLSGNKPVVKVSFPLDLLEIPVFRKTVKGKWLNGSATLDVGVRNGQLHVSPTEVTVKGKPLPQQIMKEIRNKNFAENQDNKEVMARIENVEVKDGKLIITPKKPAPIPVTPP